MKILVACEESQAVCKAFREKGHEAFSCDILPCSGGHPEWHIQDDVLRILNPRPMLFGSSLSGVTTDCIEFQTLDGVVHCFEGKWDMIIAFPPCTHLCSSGQWAYSKGFKDVRLREDAVDFFMMFANADCERIVIENPVGIMSSRWRKPDQIIHPWQFGHNAEKQTCLWLKGVSPLIPNVKEKPEMEYFEWVDRRTGRKKRMQKWMYDIRCISDRKERAKIASKTFPGIAKAMTQWVDPGFTESTSSNIEEVYSIL